MVELEEVLEYLGIWKPNTLYDDVYSPKLTRDLSSQIQEEFKLSIWWSPEHEVWMSHGDAITKSDIDMKVAIVKAAAEVVRFRKRNEEMSDFRK